jgi:hypothetical protein
MGLLVGIGKAQNNTADNSLIVTYYAPFKYWEPENDDENPNAFNWNGFQDNSVVQIICRNIQDLFKNGIQIQIGISEAPD